MLKRNIRLSPVIIDENWRIDWRRLTCKSQRNLLLWQQRDTRITVPSVHPFQHPQNRSESHLYHRWESDLWYRWESHPFWGCESPFFKTAEFPFSRPAERSAGTGEKRGTYRSAVITQITQITQIIIDYSWFIRKKENQKNLRNLRNRPNGACWKETYRFRL